MHASYFTGGLITGASSISKQMPFNLMNVAAARLAAYVYMHVI